MIENVNNNQINGMPANPLEQTGKTTPKASGKKPVDMNIKADYKALGQKAIEADKTNNPEKIQQAQQMIASGEIDNIENIRQAAENIIKYGI